jgi:hypothetical protein
MLCMEIILFVLRSIENTLNVVCGHKVEFFNFTTVYNSIITSVLHILDLKLKPIAIFYINYISGI